MSIVARFFPNGEFTHGVDTSQKRKQKRRHQTTQTYPLDPKRRDEYLQWREDNADILKTQTSFSKDSLWVAPCGNDYTCTELGKDFCILQWADTHGRIYDTRLPYSLETACFLWRLRPLVHQSVESCDKPESRKKLVSMTRPMARNIRNAVYLLEQQPGGKDLLSFLTLTLPNLSTESLNKCSEHWDSLVKRFMDWLRVTLQRKGVEFQYVYCTEIQTKRLEIRHEYAPHLHIVFRGRDGKKKPWVITPKQARQAWRRCIASVVDERFDGSALENLQRIRHSAARYLSKYLTKGRCSIPSNSEGHSIQLLRTQWGGMSRALSRRILQFTTRFNSSSKGSDYLADIFANMDVLIERGIVKYYRKGFIALGIDKTTGMEYGLHVGSGCLRIPAYEGGLVGVIEFMHRYDCLYRALEASAILEVL